MRYPPLRDNRGAAVIGLCLGLSLFLLLIGFFVFDMNRMQMAQRQVSALADAASIAGSAMLTANDVSYETSNLSVLYNTQLAAEAYAKNMVAMGNILGSQIYDPAVSSPPTNGIAINSVSSQSSLASPSAGKLNVFIQLCSPINNYAPIAAGNSDARAVYVQTAFGYVPVLSILGLGTVALPSGAIGSLQKLCVIFVFDCSGSMDDNTVVTFVERRWSTASDSAAIQATNGGRGQYIYQVVSDTGGSTGQLWEYSGLNYQNQPNGTPLNVLPPQNLDVLGFCYGTTVSANANSNTNFGGSPALTLDFAIRDYVSWFAGISLAPAASKTCYPVSGSGFQGPAYDNDFGTPPGNCPVKYGPAIPSWTSASATPASLGWAYGVTSGSVLQNMNIWYGNSTQAPGPDVSPGYQYYGPTGQANSSSPSDGLYYYYDPYSMPSPFTANGAYTPFTDLVANISSISCPQTQPLYGPATFGSGFSYTFPNSSFYVPYAESNSSTGSGQNWFYYEFDNDATTGLQSKTYKFASVAYLVEAARGNLDLDPSNNGQATNYTNALLSFGNGSGITQPAITDCKYGYQKAYQRLATYCLQPYATAVDGAYRFFQNLTATTASCFGFVGFSIAPQTNSQFVSKYMSVSADQENGGSPGYYSLALGAPANTGPGLANSYGPYCAYSYCPHLLHTNANFWLTQPYVSQNNVLIGGPAGSPTGIPYSSTLNSSGPSAQNTWIKSVSGGSPAPSNSNTRWAFNNPGFQIPRYPLIASSDSYSSGNNEKASYVGVAGSNWWSWVSWNTGGSGGNGDSRQGYNGLFHTLPLYDTDSLEALTVALYNLTNIAALNTETGLSTGLSLPTLGPGTKKAIVFFTDGVPTDVSTGAYTSYTTNVVTPAQQAGVAIYAIGLALNSNLKTEQANFLSTLANKGANGSQFFQITSNANLTSTFTGISRQLAQCQR